MSALVLLPGIPPRTRAMPEPLKLLLDTPLVLATGRHLARAWPPFDRARFERQALDGLDALALKARAMQIAHALDATLPPTLDEAASVMEAALAPPRPDPDDDLAPAADPPEADAGLHGWVLWPMGEVVARRGLAAPADTERALRALHAFTQRFTAEFAIRPLLQAQPQPVLATLARWVHDPSPHVRRLVSEGSRPRLPWGLQLKSLIADPSPTLPLLRALQDDPSGYVRRSVANHLNDIAKDHPAVVTAWLREHLPGAPAPRAALLRHAARTLVKQGDADALTAFGLGAPLRGRATLAASPAAITLGDTLTLEVALTSTAHADQALAIDYAVHHVKADGRTSPKVFKGWVATLPARGTLALRKRHAVRPITIRTYHPGVHRVELQVNGRVVAETAFELRLAR